MLYITLLERIVERDTNPASEDFNHVINMYSKPVDNYGPYTSSVVPRVGEIVCTSEGKYFDVVAVIHGTYIQAGFAHDSVTLEVKPHNNVHLHNAGPYSFNESWPVITDLPQK